MSEEIDPFAEPTEEEKAAMEAAEKDAAEKKKDKKEKVGKSTLVLGVNPADTEIDLDKLEAKIREIKVDGLLWGKSQHEKKCFGLYQIQIGAVVTDDVSVDDLQTTIESWKDEVASTEILAFQKLT